VNKNCAFFEARDDSEWNLDRPVFSVASLGRSEDLQMF
jgi:hypothetical protein